MITKSKIQIKNHSDFRRICQKGKVKFETLTLADNAVGTRLWVGMVRSIKKVDTTGVYLALPDDDSRGSFLGFDKAADWVFEGDVAKNTKFGYSYKLIEG